MGDSPDDDRDDEFFKEVYSKEYTGPPTLNTDKMLDNSKGNKRARGGNDSEEEEQERDPNAVPTDFTSREARVWEAKSKAIERNYKRKKEEEFICKICGESGHFTQGCPTTLGANRSREFVEKVPVKDKRLKPRIIGSGGSVVQKIEKDTGCKIRIEDNHGSGDGSFFIRVAGPDRLCLLKGTDAVKKLINESEDQGKVHGSRDSRQSRTDQSASQRTPQRTCSRSRSPRPRSRYSYEEKHPVDHRFSQSEGRRKYDDGTAHVRNSPKFPPYSNKSDRNSSQRYGHTLERNMERSMYEGEKWASDMRSKDLDTEFRGEQRPFPKNLNVLEQDFSKETFELFKAKTAEEDEENRKHRERIKELQEDFQRNLGSLRAKQTKEWEDFMQRETHSLQRHYQQQMDHGPPGYAGVGNSGYGGPGGGGSGLSSYGENISIDQQGSRYSGAYDMHQEPRPNSYGNRATYAAGLYGNPQSYNAYR